MSSRVMSSLKHFVPDIEIYSIDEAFLNLEKINSLTLLDEMITIRKLIYQWTGIPVSIGVGPTKTLAKLANRIAKKHSSNGVYFLPISNHLNKILKDMCDRHNKDYYKKYKNWCDEYFYLPHRKEARGIGGIFFDYKKNNFEKDFKFVRDVGVTFQFIFNKIIRKKFKITIFFPILLHYL